MAVMIQHRYTQTLSLILDKLSEILLQINQLIAWKVALVGKQMNTAKEFH